MNDEEMKDLIKRLVRARATDEVLGAIEGWLIDHDYSDEWEDTAECDLGDGETAQLHRWYVWVHEEQERDSARRMKLWKQLGRGQGV